jgi:L-fuculose-phosphate aldolase
MTTFDLTKYKVVTAEDVDAAVRAGASVLLVRENAMVTGIAQDIIASKGLTVQTATGSVSSSAAPAAGGGAYSSNAKPGASSAQWDALFHSPEAEKVKAEICAIGKKLWMRQYVDGNGGNISFRIAENAVICTPTLMSKADLTPADLCMVDLQGNQLAGTKARTSEILLHLEIYKAVPEAKAAVHCHPPHATAYAITGRVPPTCIIPEYEVFVGKVALSPYETPGTQKFAETVIPYVKSHNTVLLSNHGIICWADTVTHAEWYAEVVDTYCWTLMLASQLGAPLTHIPSEKAGDLVAIKQKLGLPDPRLDIKECQLCDLPEHPGGIASLPPNYLNSGGSDSEAEALVQAVTEAVVKALGDRVKG